MTTPPDVLRRRMATIGFKGDIHDEYGVQIVTCHRCFWSYRWVPALSRSEAGPIALLAAIEKHAAEHRESDKPDPLEGYEGLRGL